MPAEGNDSQGLRIEVCVLCGKLLQRQREIAAFQLTREAAKSNKVVLWYGTLMALRGEIDKVRRRVHPLLKL